MKRLIICLGVLLLLLNAADDGFIAPQHLLSSVAVNHRGNQQPSNGVIGQRNVTVVLLVNYLLQISRHSYYRSVAAEVLYPDKITLCSHMCSSGGLPS